MSARLSTWWLDRRYGELLSSRCAGAALLCCRPARRL